MSVSKEAVQAVARAKPVVRIRSFCRAELFARGRLLSRGFLSLLPLILPPLILGGCRDEVETGDPGLILDVAISPTPPVVGQARLIITMEDTSGAPMEDARIVVEGNMSHAGMTPVVDTAQAEGSGQYGISDFGFTMAGDWILSLYATLPDGRWVRVQERTNVVGGMGGNR